MIVSVASGKGGTGKTTVAVNLALSTRNVQLIDCDVEEPNCHVLLGVRLGKVEEVCVPNPRIEKGKCNFCGKCAEFCKNHALAVLPSDVLLFPELCSGCGGCILVCPRGAIEEEMRSVGVVSRGTINGIEFYQGLLNIGEARAIPVIRALKKRIGNDKTAILDASPGVSCPVVETIRDSDYCILVTEPTPFGLHDLKIAVQVARKLEVLHGVVVNRDGIGDERVYEWCEAQGIPILMRIPYSKRIARLCSEGVAPVRRMPELRSKFEELFDAVNGD
jgi:MinD superfamily P-loop ATPase